MAPPYVGAGSKHTGSHNPGMTNVLAHRRPSALITLLGDAGKGAFIILAARFMHFPQDQICILAGATFLGHLFHCGIRFKVAKAWQHS